MSQHLVTQYVTNPTSRDCLAREGETEGGEWSGSQTLAVMGRNKAGGLVKTVLVIRAGRNYTSERRSAICMHCPSQGSGTKVVVQEDRKVGECKDTWYETRGAEPTGGVMRIAREMRVAARKT